MQVFLGKIVVLISFSRGLYIFDDDRYENDSGKIMSSAAAAQLLSVTLYYRRFFPYYAFCMLAGLDENGNYWI